MTTAVCLYEVVSEDMAVVPFWRFAPAKAGCSAAFAEQLLEGRVHAVVRLSALVTGGRTT